MNLEELIRVVPDWPKKGVQFRDITPLLKDPAAFPRLIEELGDLHRGTRVDVVAGIEARGFILAAPLACRLGAGFVPIRKKGKLPAPAFSQEYALEYGADTLEIHRDAITPGQKVLLVDDILATGGSALAAVRLIRQGQGILTGVSFIAHLPALGGDAKLTGEGIPWRSLTRF